MLTRLTSYLKIRRRGMASTFGTIIFIGILFTSVIPMYILMKQADTIYEQDMLELKRLDDERDRESLYVYAYPKGTTSDQVELKVENVCEVQVDVVRIWVNDTSIDQSVSISPMDEAFIGPFTLSTDPSENYTYKFRLVTGRGNVYVPTSGSVLSCSGGEWNTQHLSINVVVDAGGVLGIAKYEVTVTNDTTYYSQETTGYVAGTQFWIFDVTECGGGNFHVLIRAKPLWQEWSTLIDDDYLLNFPEGPPDLWVRYSP